MRECSATDNTAQTMLCSHGKGCQGVRACHCQFAGQPETARPMQPCAASIHKTRACRSCAPSFHSLDPVASIDTFAMMQSMSVMHLASWCRRHNATMRLGWGGGGAADQQATQPGLGGAGGGTSCMHHGHCLLPVIMPTLLPSLRQQPASCCSTGRWPRSALRQPAAG
jgi:hypothetical protein